MEEFLEMGKFLSSSRYLGVVHLVKSFSSRSKELEYAEMCAGRGNNLQLFSILSTIYFDFFFYNIINEMTLITEQDHNY